MEMEYYKFNKKIFLDVFLRVLIIFSYRQNVVDGLTCIGFYRKVFMVCSI